MCAGCADWIAACDRIECGASPRIAPDGKVRARYLKHYYLDDIPCAHAPVGHGEACGLGRGRDCDCKDDED